MIANANFEALFSNQCHNSPFKIREKEKEPTFYDWSKYVLIHTISFRDSLFSFTDFLVHRPETNFVTNSQSKYLFYLFQISVFI